MARKPRLEVEGGPYHLITRGVDRRDIFHSPEDHQKFSPVVGSAEGEAALLSLRILPDDQPPSSADDAALQNIREDANVNHATSEVLKHLSRNERIIKKVGLTHFYKVQT